MVNLVGKSVLIEGGKVFVVEEQNGNTISFNDKVRVRSFDIETAFSTGYLTAVDEDVQAAIMEELKTKNDALQIQQAQVEEAHRLSKLAVERQDFNRRFNKGYNPEHMLCEKPLNYVDVENMFGIHIIYSGHGIYDLDDCLVLFSNVNPTAYYYHDYWQDENTYVYLGANQRVNQTINSQNQAIIDSIKVGKPIYLFVKLSANEYYYQSEMEYVSHECDEIIDLKGGKRNQYQFTLKRKYNLDGSTIYPKCLLNQD